jgi:subtilisin family serine protease
MLHVPRKTGGAPLRPRLRLEQLEDRCLPSASPAALIDLSTIAPAPGAAPSDILVAFTPAALAQGSPIALPGTVIGTPLPLVPGLYEVDLEAGTSLAQALQEYQADSLVRYAEVDGLLTSAMTPNDPQFSSQWDMAAISAPAAWNVTTGSTAVTIAVMDSGIDYTHPDLYQNVWLNQAEIPNLPFAPGTGLTGSRRSELADENGDGLITFADLTYKAPNGTYPDQGLGKITAANGGHVVTAADILQPMVTETINGVLYDTGQGGWAYSGNTQDGDTAHPNDFIGWNFVANTNDPSDDNGHGTHVSGTIGAVGNNGVGIAGLDWNAQLMPVKWLGSNATGSVSTFVLGLNYAVQHGAKISNNSWAGSFSQSLYDAVNAARSAGQIFVAAAGNGATNNDLTPTYPANLGLDNVVSVAATDNNDNLASFSNYGLNTVALGAPGVNILSTLPGGNYGQDSGTSMAVPHVVGVMALVWTEHPTWTYSQVIAQVLNTTDKIPSLQGKTSTGGLLDAAAALGVANNSPTVLSDQLLTNGSGTAYGIQLTFSQSMNPATVNSSSVTITAPNGAVYYPDWVSTVAGSGNQTFQLGFGKMTTAGTYSVHVSANALDTNGNALTPYTGTLTVSSGTNSGPQVVSAQLLVNSAGAPIGVTLTFNRAMNPATVNSSSVTITAANGAVYYPDWVNVVPGSGNQTFQLGFSKMTLGGSYVVHVSANALDSNGNALTPFQGSLS